jgi:hypothetical protein
MTALRLSASPRKTPPALLRGGVRFAGVPGSPLLDASNVLDLALNACIRGNFGSVGAPPNVTTDLLPKHINQLTSHLRFADGIHPIKRRWTAASGAIRARRFRLGFAADFAAEAAQLLCCFVFHDAPIKSEALGFVKDKIKLFFTGLFCGANAKPSNRGSERKDQRRDAAPKTMKNTTEDHRGDSLAASPGSAIFTVRKTRTAYGKGSPGWNASIKIVDSLGREIAYASWPMVHGPTVCGFRDYAAARAADKALKEGEATLGQIGPYVTEYALSRHSPNAEMSQPVGAKKI